MSVVICSTKNQIDVFGGSIIGQPSRTGAKYRQKHGDRADTGKWGQRYSSINRLVPPVSTVLLPLHRYRIYARAENETKTDL